VIDVSVWGFEDLVLVGGWLMEMVIMGRVWSTTHSFLDYDTFVLYRYSSNTLCHLHMADTFILHSAITSSSATAMFWVPLLTYIPTIASIRPFMKQTTVFADVKIPGPALVSSEYSSVQ
jgi:hypothetical protein